VTTFVVIASFNPNERAMKIRPLAAFAFLALLVPTARAGGPPTVYVDASALPPGDGTLANPYPTIDQAIQRQGPGGPIVVGPGTYVETLDIRSSTVVSTHGPLETIIKPADPADPIVVVMGGVSTLDGFTVTRDTFTDDQVGVCQPDIMTQVWLRNSIVTGHGRGVDCEYAINISNSTITANRIGMANTFDAIYNTNNSIVHGNSFQDVQGGAVSGDWSNVGGAPCIGSSCQNNIDVDPEFWDPAGDFHLRADSPCIDAGNPASPLDPDGSLVDMGALTFDTGYAPGTQTYCFGNDVECPCANGGDGLGGCEIPQGTGGVRIAIQDFLPDGSGGGTTEIVGTGYPVMSAPGVTLIRSPAVQNPPVVFGDGLRCISATGLLRIRASLATGGSVTLPVMHGAGAGTFYYQLWNRSQPVMFCDPAAAFNLSNALEIAWP
jgi:hypothetical protein